MTKLENLENSYMHKADFLQHLNSFIANLKTELVDQYIVRLIHLIVGRKRLINVHHIAKSLNLNRHSNVPKKIETETRAEINE